jgi:D-sedoheptulose 7-phosphate isomerase
MELADFVLAMPVSETSKIQELHILCGHIVCAPVETALFG